MDETYTAHLLIVDDEPDQLRALCSTLGDRGFTTVGCQTAAEALAMLRTREFDLLLTDLMLPDTDGISLLQTALAIRPDLVGVLMTGHGTIGTAVESMKRGALDYILKPFKLTDVLPVLYRALTVRELRRERAELAARIEARTAELETANRDLDAFARSVSHDLRAPIRAMDGYSGILLQDAAPQLSGLHRALLENIHRTAADMTRLVDGLLAFCRSGRQALAKAPVAMTDLVRGVVDEVALQYPGRTVEVEVGDLPECFADPELLRQALVNLISNAFKYTGKNDLARVAVGSQSHGDGVAYFVRDNGAGFDMQYANKLFGVFQRLHGTHEFEGTGVGLSIAHRIIERHGGRIWADAQPGKGATFSFTLP